MEEKSRGDVMATLETKIAQQAATTRKRSLILAGGGLKVAFQAGVMQVWLDEAGLKFDHADGASGGCFNLAMYCQGMTGKRIADNWRNLDPTAGVTLNWQQYARLFFAKSMFTMEGYRKNVFPKWGLDWAKIRASSKEATFNLYNFSKQQLEIAAPKQMDEDHLCAAVALPMFFPPVVLNGDTYIDPVYVTDGNLEEAIRRGADELWVIWTVSQRGEWDDGFVDNYFQIIEATANGRLHQIQDRISANNNAIASGKPGEFGRPIVVKMLQAEVSLNYLVDFSADRVAEAVNQGVQTARQWCTQYGIPFTPLPDVAPQPAMAAVTSLQFTEEMKGFLTLGETDYDKGFRTGKANGTDAMVHLTIKTDDVDAFVTDPQHVASATGYFKGDIFGGQRPVEQGIFNLFVDNGDPDRKAMYYRLFFTDQTGNPLTLLGFKDVRGAKVSDVWTDTTTLFTRILKGHVGALADGGANILAAGIIHIHFLDFLEELTTFRTEGPTLAARASAMQRFGSLFLSKLWDVYAHNILPASPF
jgi:predicted acylesterase/phospholipase RssA